MMFDTVLVANRGEIARRLIRAVQDLGLTAIAVYSDADKGAPYVREADKAVYIGSSEPANSYLDIQKILDAAEASGAGAIHPGYGFLSENAHFARACEALNIAFIGPKSSIIDEMGSKIAAKTCAIAAGVPVVPGYQGEEQTDEALITAGVDVGFPLMVKASAGGGGRGMRLVLDAAELTSAIPLARQEAKSAFGNGDLLLERYIPTARHVEVQILGDKAGHVIHLFDRDCSLQRNHQKVVEEAPAPYLPDDVRDAMQRAATALAQEIGYDSAGTVEFIYDPASQEFFFLEMNTRLQVEHPVTEMITGVDIAAWQIRIANGEKLNLNQSDINCNGWAIEARVAAEDPANGYMPQTGAVTYYQEPAGPNVRVDSGIEQGSIVSHYYDSLIAKVIVQGATREAAIGKLLKALKNYHLVGVITNIPFLNDILKNTDFQGATHHTQTLKQILDQGWQPLTPSLKEKAVALIAYHLNHQMQGRQKGPWSTLSNWRITGRLGRSGAAYYYVSGEDGTLMPVSITHQSSDYLVKIGDETEVSIKLHGFFDGEISIYNQGIIETFQCNTLDGDITLFGAGAPFTLRPLMAEEALLSRRDNGGGSGDQVMAPMPGLVVEILTEVGASVIKGEPLIVLEAMKLMQNLLAPCDGLVEQISAVVGDTPEKGAVLIKIKTEQTAD